MPVLDLSAYKPVPATLGDANQVANGMQAIQNCINALDNNNFAAGRIFDPAKLMQNAAIDGDPLVWDNTLTKWVPASTLAAGRPRAPRVVTSPMSGGPPASPVDQDIWIATNVDTNGTRWGFQYNAGSGSAHKWEFIGGTALTATRGGTLTTGSVSLVVLTGAPTLTAPRAGEYVVTVGGFAQAQTLSSAFDAFIVATNAGSAIASGHYTHTAVFSGGNATETFSPATLSAGTVIDIRVSLGAANGTCSFQNGWLDLVPLRIA